jgi:hypothetical protein
MAQQELMAKLADVDEPFKPFLEADTPFTMRSVCDF